MKTNILRTPLSVLAVFGGLVLASSCGDDDNATPSTVDIGDEDAGQKPSDEDAATTTTTTTTTGSGSTAGDAGVTTGEDDAGEPTSEDEVDAGEPTSEGDAGETTEPPSSEDAGPGDGDCVSKPQTPEEFLTQCTTSQCAPFDNSRLGRYVEGEPLPTP